MARTAAHDRASRSDCDRDAEQIQRGARRLHYAAAMPVLAGSKHLDPLPWTSQLAMAQVGWLGQTGAVYALDDQPYDSREPGGFGPLYIPIGVWEDLGDGHYAIKD